MAQAQSMWAINRRGKKRGSVTYSMDREDKVSRILYLYCVSDGFGNDFMQNGFKFLMHLESKMSQFEIGVQSIAHLSKRKF